MLGKLSICFDYFVLPQAARIPQASKLTLHTTQHAQQRNSRHWRITPSYFHPQIDTPPAHMPSCSLLLLIKWRTTPPGKIKPFEGAPPPSSPTSSHVQIASVSLTPSISASLYEMSRLCPTLSKMPPSGQIRVQSLPIFLLTFTAKCSPWFPVLTFSAQLSFRNHTHRCTHIPHTYICIIRAHTQAHICGDTSSMDDIWLVL